MPQLQHNMWVTNGRDAVLSIITGGVKICADTLYQHLLLAAEKKSGAVYRAARPLTYSASNRRALVSRQFALSI
jgi:hypothetical protein